MLPPFDPWRFGAVGLDIAAVSVGGRAGVLARQRRRLTALLQAAGERSPLYRKRLGTRALPKLADIEPVTKSELMRRFDDWVADPELSLPALLRFASDPARIGDACPGGHVLWTSSGSSGKPGVFVQDSRALAIYDALEALRRPPLRTLAQWLAGWRGERIAFVGATNGHFASTVSVERLRRLAPAFAGALRSFSFLQPMRELIAQLEAWAPTVLASYPSTALALAGERRTGRLDIAPQEIWTGGETLTAAARAEIERAFGCRVANSYGASEFFTLGSECRAGALHLNADWAILEPVDREGRPVPEGQASDTVLLTNLANHLQPIIRYDLGDRVTLLPGTCACGSPLPRLQVDGRCGDLLALRDAHRRLVRLAPLAIETVLEEHAGVFDFHLEQISPSALALRVPGAGTDPLRALDRAGTALAAYLAAQGLGNVRVDARLGQRRAPQASGKQRRIVGLGAAAGQGARGSSPRHRSMVGEQR